MADHVGSFYIFNGSMEAISTMQEVDPQKFKVVYEVIRIIDRVPLYLEDHYARLENSLRLLGLSAALSLKELRDQIIKLADANQLRNCNVKLILYHLEGKQNHILYISQSYYPSTEEVNTGVPVGIFRWVRHDPNAKVVNAAYKEEVAKKMKESNAFELLLVNEEGKITEGSRSNAFFVKGMKVYTAPGEQVLKGITRQYVQEACARVGIEVVEELVAVEDLETVDGLFISGTSIKVLPVSAVEGRPYTSAANPVIVAVRDEFDRMLQEYITAHA